MNCDLDFGHIFPPCIKPLCIAKRYRQHNFAESTIFMILCLRRFDRLLDGLIDEQRLAKLGHYEKRRVDRRAGRVRAVVGIRRAALLAIYDGGVEWAEASGHTDKCTGGGGE